MKKSQGDVFRRREKIIALLQTKEQLVISELAEFFQVSAVTIRRDLLFLEKKRFVERFYGGVRLAATLASTQNIQSSGAFPVTAFVEALAPFLTKGTKIFVGAGLYSTSIIHALSAFDISILTNDYLAGALEDPQSAMVAISGGEREHDTHALVGDLASYSFIKSEASLCILEAAGFNLHEVTTNTLNESYIYRTMMEHTKGPKLVYLPSDRLDRVENFMINHTFLFDCLYTDANISAELLERYRQCVNVIVLDADKRS